MRGLVLLLACALVGCGSARSTGGGDKAPDEPAPVPTGGGTGAGGSAGPAAAAPVNWVGQEVLPAVDEVPVRDADGTVIGTWWVTLADVLRDEGEWVVIR